jgi:DNA adenine methylase
MKYMGSKNRIAKYLLPIILKDRKPDQWYVEPFVGGANMIDKVDGNRIGSDFNCSVVDALIFIRDCTTPLSNIEYTEYDYNNAANLARKGKTLSGVDSYALIAFSFGAKWIGGWSRGKNSKGEQRDYVSEQYRASEKQKPLLQGIKLKSCSYSSIEIPNESIIYCDPPYAGTTKYRDELDYGLFWQWCRDMSKKGHEVFISEYNAPNDFECLWQKEIQSGLNTDTTKKAVEKLFKYNPYFKQL